MWGGWRPSRILLAVYNTIEAVSRTSILLLSAAVFFFVLQQFEFFFYAICCCCVCQPAFCLGVLALTTITRMPAYDGLDFRNGLF